VKLFAIGGARLRAVTHYQVTAEDVAEALRVCRTVLA